MTERKRFKKQELNSNDYEKTEGMARILKNGSVITSACAAFLVVAKKCGPKIIEEFKKFRK